MVVLGCWLYLAGSVLYWLGSVLSLIWTRAILARKEELLERRIRSRKRREDQAATVIEKAFKRVLGTRRKQAVRSILNDVYGEAVHKSILVEDALERVEGALGEESDDDDDDDNEDSVVGLALKELASVKAWFSGPAAARELEA